MNKDFDWNEIGKRTPFRTPEGFFDRIQAETLKRVAEEKRKKKLYRLKWGISVTLAVAAMLVGFIFFPLSSSESSEQSSSIDWVAQTDKEADVLDLYIQGLSDEELEEWIEFSENDIYYELTTENLNEDEN